MCSEQHPPTRMSHRARDQSRPTPTTSTAAATATTAAAAAAAAAAPSCRHPRPFFLSDGPPKRTVCADVVHPQLAVLHLALGALRLRDRGPVALKLETRRQNAAVAHQQNTRQHVVAHLWVALPLAHPQLARGVMCAGWALSGRSERPRCTARWSSTSPTW